MLGGLVVGAGVDAAGESLDDAFVGEPVKVFGGDVVLGQFLGAKDAFLGEDFLMRWRLFMGGFRK